MELPSHAYDGGSLNSERIALNRTTATLDFLDRGGWNDQPSHRLQNCMIESLRKRPLNAVSRETSG